MMIQKIGKINVNDPFLGNNKNVVVPGNKINKSIGKNNKIVKKSDDSFELSGYIIKRETLGHKKQGNKQRKNNQKKSGGNPWSIGDEMFA